MPTKNIPKFIGGFLYEFVGINNLDFIEGCFTGGAKMVNQLESAISDFKHGGAIHISRGIVTLKNLVAEIPTELSNCEGIP